MDTNRSDALGIIEGRTPREIMTARHRTRLLALEGRPGPEPMDGSPIRDPYAKMRGEVGDYFGIHPAVMHRLEFGDAEGKRVYADLVSCWAHRPDNPPASYSERLRAVEDDPDGSPVTGALVVLSSFLVVLILAFAIAICSAASFCWGCLRAVWRHPRLGWAFGVIFTSVVWLPLAVAAIAMAVGLLHVPEWMNR